MEIALFGGSFDPPHVGHLLAAAYVLATEPVDELWFVPVAGHPLGKPLQAPFEHRAELCELAIADLGLRRARVSRVEAELGGEGRTVDLLEHLHRAHPQHRWALVLGYQAAKSRDDVIGELSEQLIDRLFEDFGDIAVARLGERLDEMDPGRVKKLRAARRKRS